MTLYVQIAGCRVHTWEKVEFRVKGGTLTVARGDQVVAEYNLGAGGWWSTEEPVEFEHPTEVEDEDDEDDWLSESWKLSGESD